ncbi:hypothetical protein CR513_10051, partial [Mucuna pruriens]
MIVTSSPSAPRMSNIKYFKCLGKDHIASHSPNRKAMILRDDGKIASDSSHRETSTSSELESRSDDSHVEGDFLIVKRYHVFGNLCSIIIDGSSCVNVASEELVSKLALPTIPHSRPIDFGGLVSMQIVESTPHADFVSISRLNSTCQLRLRLLSSSEPSETVLAAKLSELFSSKFEHMII